MLDGSIIIYLVLLIGLAFIPANIASKKGYSFGGFYAFGFFFFLPALIVAAILEDKVAASEREECLREEISRLREDMTTQASGGTSRDALSQRPVHPICGQCGHQNNAGIKYCTKCGTTLTYTSKPESAICPKCRENITAGDEFCGNCGWNLNETAPEAVLITAIDGEALCPLCGAVQKSDRSHCFKCGAQFEYC